MIEAGATYELTLFDGESYERRTATVQEVALPLIKIEGPGGPLIINVHSSAFVSAEINDPEVRAQRHKEWLGSIEGEADQQRRQSDNAKLEAARRNQKGIV